MLLLPRKDTGEENNKFGKVEPSDDVTETVIVSIIDLNPVLKWRDVKN